MTNTKYLICRTPRVGSYLLASLLENAGITGQTYPREMLTHKRIDSEGIVWNAEKVRKFIEKIFELRSTLGGGAGFNIGWDNLEYIVLKMGRNEKVTVRDIPLLFPPDVKYIYLTRKDEVRQAISYIKMVQSGIMKVRNGRKSKFFDSFVFDFWGIAASITKFRRQKRHGRSFLNVTGFSLLGLNTRSGQKILREPLCGC